MRNGLRHHAGVFAFDGIEFPGSEWTTHDGHDSARHQAFGRPGARIEDTGAKVTTVRVKAMLFNGLRGWTGEPLFPTVYERLLRALRSTPEALLTHPTRGIMTVHVDEVVEHGDPKVDAGISLDLTFSEQDGSGDVLEFNTGTLPSSGEAALTSAAEADTARPAGVKAPADLADQVAEALDFLEETSRGWAETVATLDALRGDIASRLEDPAAAIVDAHPYRAALYATLSALQGYREVYLGAEPRTYTVVQEASLAQLAALPEVYGDASRASDLLSANQITDPTRVPVGTALRVVD